MRGVFVTGTDTHVGKTVVCAALMHRLRPESAVRYWKPVQTGIGQDDDTGTVRVLGDCGPGEIHESGVRLPHPLSPHLAARLAGRTIDVGALLADVPAGATGTQTLRWIVEGAGGALVPLNDEQLMIDLMTRVSAPVLVVARTALGTINHTLLTLDALRCRQLVVAGVVMVGDRSRDNRAAIERFGGVPVLGEMPRLEPLTPDAIRTWAVRELDPEGLLRP